MYGKESVPGGCRGGEVSIGSVTGEAGDGDEDTGLGRDEMR